MARFEGTSDSGPISDAVATLLRDLDSVLSPLVGRAGVAALLRRSLQLAAARHPWLLALPRGADSGLDIQAATEAFAAQARPEAAEGSADFLYGFHDLLVSLIGGSLTQRLLAAAWQDFTGSSLAPEPAS